MTRRDAIRISSGALLTLGSSHAQPAVPPSGQIVGPGGELVAAWYPSQRRGAVVMFVSKRPTTNGYRAELLFNEGTDTFLSVTATLQHKLDEKSLGQAAISFVTGGLIYTVSLDATQVSPEALANRPRQWARGRFGFG